MSEPYYTDGKVTLYNGDCREITEWLAADVLVTDPPYGIGYESNVNRDRRNTKLGLPIGGDDNLEARDRTIARWAGRPALVFGRWDSERPAGTRCRLVWDKGNSPGMGDLSIPWGRSDEEIYVLGTGFTGTRSGSVLRCQMHMSPSRSRPDHPTPKPVQLMESLILKCPPGTVADPFAGSGSTLIAARNLGRRAIGVEIDERYCEMTAKRLAQDVLDFNQEPA
ncbi:MAG: DNA-methyltransferase [Nocardioidaceae bacterium]